MKNLLIAFCCAFTAVTLLCSFNVSKHNGSYRHNATGSTYCIEKVTCDGANYIIVSSSGGGVAICPESK